MGSFPERRVYFTLNILLNMSVNRFRMNGSLTFSIFMEMLSGPVDFLLSIDLILKQIEAGVNLSKPDSGFPGFGGR